MKTITIQLSELQFERLVGFYYGSTLAMELKAMENDQFLPLYSDMREIMDVLTAVANTQSPYVASLISKYPTAEKIFDDIHGTLQELDNVMDPIKRKKFSPLRPN